MSSGSPKRERPEKFDHYLNRAKVAAERSSCLRRKVGAVIIKNDTEVSSGYVGSPRGTWDCLKIGSCLRIELTIPSGQQYELCRSVHAEQNAIINAARIGVNILGGEMYISSEKINAGYDKIRGEKPKIYGPCTICKKEIINAGLIKVHMREEGIGTNTYDIDQLKEMLSQEEEKLRRKHSKSK